VGPVSTISSSGSWLVFVASLLSNEKFPAVPVSASATPSFGSVPSTHSCTRGVMSITTN
jgi:hypothetical protein